MKIAVGVNVTDKVSIYGRSCSVWVYTCCLLLVSSYLYRHGFWFCFCFFWCCLYWEFSASSRGERNSALRQLIHGKSLYSAHANKAQTHHWIALYLVEFISVKSIYFFPNMGKFEKAIQSCNSEWISIISLPSENRHLTEGLPSDEWCHSDEHTDLQFSRPEAYMLALKQPFIGVAT